MAKGIPPEQTCGAAVWVSSGTEDRVILVRTSAGTWALPRRLRQEHETEEEAAKQAVRDAAGVSLPLEQGFRAHGPGSPATAWFLARCHPEALSGNFLPDSAILAEPDEASCLLPEGEDRSILSQVLDWLKGQAQAQCRDRVRRSLTVFDNHDPRLPHHRLMLQGRIDSLTAYRLPEGYRFATYTDGDREAWVRIEISAGESSTPAEALGNWQRYFGGHEEVLPGRMFFVLSPEGEKVATATAYYDIRRGDDGITGWLHWVAVRRDHQGLGLAKPLITRVLQAMKDLGYTHAVIPTQTTTWLACKVYLDLGFRPTPESAGQNRQGWEIIRSLTSHPALSAFADGGSLLSDLITP